MDETVESCVNYVGVDLNTASIELLAFGITPSVAKNIITYQETARLKSPAQGAEVGAKAFEQAAGFCAFAIVTTHWITQQFIPRVTMWWRRSLLIWMCR